MGCLSFISIICYRESVESLLLRRLAITIGAIATKAVGLLSSSFFSFLFFCFIFLIYSRRSYDEINGD